MEENEAAQESVDRQEREAKVPLRKRIKWDWTFLVLAVVAAVALSLAFPDKGRMARHIWWEYFKEMAFILPAVLTIMGLFMVWVDRGVVIKYLGEGSGLKGILISLFLGTLPTGPLYVGFPMAAALLKKGARVANVLVFLCSWAALSIPAELMELRFMGWKFTVARLSLTVALIVPMCLAGEFFYRRPDAGKSLGSEA
jgi:uncharacterized membrane protein YraQ (UPF0718 family)